MVICLLPLRPFHTANQLGSVRRARRTEVAMRGSATSTGIRRACTQVNFFSIFLNQRNLKMAAISNKPRWAARKVIMPNGKLSLSMDVIRIKISRFFKNTARAPGGHCRAPMVLPRAQGHSSEVRASFVGRDPPGGAVDLVSLFLPTPTW